MFRPELIVTKKGANEVFNNAGSSTGRLGLAFLTGFFHFQPLRHTCAILACL